ncbi:hypothetical protein BEP19_05190 [Ammoniphilus oxalaticus]|uniref:Glycosyl transferase n=1 Tax=Ammoniphilus oxalaticus TaxID=66863 RepID=A0A419SIK4_9BACL|nr:glycosyltransferase [Ammoniphilus oxalaticus]RKD23825.1 hypothetical protein BEP19_05190 [Ammoniphilus oxalaticus]
MNHYRRALHVIGGGEFGGAEQHIIQLLSLLPRYGYIGRVVCFYEAEFSERLRKQGIEVEVLAHGRFDLRLLTSLKQIFMKEQPDIIHTHGVKANFFSRLAARKLPIPLVTTIHSILRYDYQNQLAFFVASNMEKRTRGLNNQFIAISRSIEDTLLFEGVPNEKISLVHHGIDFDLYASGQGDKLREELALPKEAYLIGVVSRLVEAKGIEYVLQAMPTILRDQPSAHLVIVGAGPYEQTLKKMSVELSIQDHVHFLGFRKDIPDCLHSFQCFVSGSLSEGLGLNVLEAMAASIPVVVTGVGGILDFVEDEVNGLLVPLRSSTDIAIKILTLMQNDQLAQQLTEQAVKRVKTDFSLDSMGRKTADVYQKIISKNKRK